MELTDLTQWRDRARRWLRRHVLGHRRLIAGVCVGLAVLTALNVLRPAAPVTVTAAGRQVTPSLAASHPGLTVLPVRLTDGDTAALLRAGDRIDLLATDSQTGETTVVCAGALVLALPRGGGAVEGGENAVTSGLGGRLVVVGVPPSAVEPLTSASVRDFLSYAYAH